MDPADLLPARSGLPGRAPEAKDVQHLHNHIGESSAMVAMLAAMFQGIPYSLTIHGPNEFDRPSAVRTG